MADSKISELTELTEAAGEDELVIVDKLSPDETKKITKENLLSNYAELSGATYTGSVTVPQGAPDNLSFVVSGNITDFGFYNTGTGLGVGDSEGAITFIAFVDELVTYKNIRPALDNTSLGLPAHKYSNVYATNGTFDAATVDNNAVLTTASGVAIKTAYESNNDTNAFTDGDKSKLSNIEANATADQTAAEIKTAYESNNDTNAFTDGDKTKLDGAASTGKAIAMAIVFG